MTRLIAGLLAAALGAGSALADIPPPPPPKGQKYVGVDNSIVLAEGVTGHTFVLAVGQGPGPPRYTYSIIGLSKKPTPVPSGGRHTYVSVLAVPEAEATKFATEKELIAAMEAGALKDLPRMGVGGTDLLPVTDKRDSVPWKFIITGIDPKKGITVRKERDGKLVEDKERGSLAPAGEGVSGDRLAGDVGGFHALVAGLFVTVALVGLGLWLAGRRRTL